MTEVVRNKLPVNLMGIPVSSANMGVQALGASLVNLCHQPGRELRILDGHFRPETVSFQTRTGRVEIPVFNYRLSPRSAPGQHLVTIVLATLLYRFVPLRSLRGWLVRSNRWLASLTDGGWTGDIRGGDSFSDIYGLRRFLLAFFPVWTVLLLQRSIVLFPQTFGPFRHPVAQWLARYIVRRARVVVARDQESQRVALSLTRPGQEVLLSPDVAFSLEPATPAEILLDPPLPSPRAPAPAGGVIGLNVNGLMFNGGYTRANMFGLKMDYPAFLRQLLTRLLVEQAGEIWLIPHTYAPSGDVESDNEASFKLRDSLPPAERARVRIIAGNYNQHEVKGVIGTCDFFVGSRMHSCIAALSQGVPCVGVAYSRKFEGVFASVGVADWVVDGRTVATGDAVTQVLSLYRRRVEIREPLRREAAAARSRLAEVFQVIATQAGSATS